MATKITRKDVAELANVSETIVSYVVNDNRYVDKSKKERVLKAIEELHYRPNPIARSLKGKNSYHILFIADQIDNEHFGKIVKEMDNFAYEKGYLVSLIANRNDQAFIDNITARQVDGIIINSASFKEEYIEKILAQGFPVVLIMMRGYKQPFEKASKIYTGIYQGMKNSIGYLLSKGRRNLLYIDRVSSRGNFSGSDDWRLKGFLDSAKEHNLNYGMENVITGCATDDEAVKKIADKIKQNPSIDGIVGRNDLMSLLGMKGVKLSGKKCPEDIAVIGFDNSRISEYTNPPLSTVEIDRISIAHNAVEMLCAMLSGKEPQQVNLSTKLIEREST